MSDFAIAENLAFRSVVAALAVSEERYRLLVEGVRRYAIFMLDPKGVIITWNLGARELLGYERHEMLGKSGSIVFSAADGASRAFRQELAAATLSGECVTERTNVRKDGVAIRVHDTVSAIRDGHGRLIGFAKVSREMDLPAEALAEAHSELAQALATIQREVEHRQRLEAQLLTAVEEEREKLGRDLHDDFSQRLAGIALMTRALATEGKGRNAMDREKLTQIGDMLVETAALARNIARGMHPVTLKSQGLPAALAELAERVPKEVQCNRPRAPRLNLEASVSLHAYRIAEEAVGNAIRHSEATEITLELTAASATQAMLTIRDNGKGFPEGPLSMGMGLQNMRYRARVIGGQLRIASTPGEGTWITCTLPLEKEKSAASRSREKRESSSRPKYARGAMS